MYACVSTRIPIPPGRFNPVMRPGEGENVTAIFRIDPALDRMAPALYRHLDDILQALAGRDSNLGLYQVDSGDHLGDRVFHLDSSVHFDEIQVPALVHQELYGSGVGVAEFAQRDREAL